KGWLTGVGRLPTPLRGDREDKPDLGWASVADTHELDDELDRVARDGGAYAIREERRLAYVALTRARHRMLLTAPVWSTGKRPRVTSRFLDEVRAGAEVGVDVRVWEPMPDPDDPRENQNPRLAEEETAPWPVDPPARRRHVQDVATALLSARAARPADRPAAPGAMADLAVQLLAEREEARRTAPAPVLPEHLSTSAVVELAGDPERFRSRLRRPLPTPPAGHARLGTAFHAWVEQHYAAAALVDLH